MTLVSAWIMVLAVVRDRAALVMTYLLPPLLFVVFAAIFAGTTGKDLKLKFGILDAALTDDSRRLVDALGKERTIRLTVLDHGGASDLRMLVRRGTVDAGILIRTDLRRTGKEPPILIFQSETKALAGVMAQGQVLRSISSALPDVLSARLVGSMYRDGKVDPRIAAPSKRSDDGKAQPLGVGLVATDVAASTGTNGNVLYYAASVSAIFLLFGAVHGAMSVIDERSNGTLERLRLGWRGLASMIAGKLLFLVVQGCAQAAIVYLVARLVYGAGFDFRVFGLWLGSCLFSAAAAAALAMALCAPCRTRKQAEGLTTFTVLIVSAAGGSMIPRYLMPPWFQKVSWLTPNSWMIESLERSVLPGAVAGDLVPSWTILAAMTLVGATLGTIMLVRRI